MKFFLCDDEREIHPVYEKRIRELCKKHSIECDFTSYLNGEQLLFDFENQDAFNGVLFLDINMPQIDGISVAKQLQDMGCQAELIFLTVSKRHFLLAFDVGAANYLVKEETSDGRFEGVFLRAVKAVLDRQEEYLLFTCGGERRSVMIQKITYFEVDKRVITVHYGDDETFSFISTIGQIEDQLYGKGFVRVNRSFLVAVRFIESVSYRELRMRDGTILSVGRKHYPVIREALDGIASNSAVN